jgi:hypothetical protein
MNGNGARSTGLFLKNEFFACGALVLAGVVMLVLMGCGGEATPGSQALVSDANGHQCAECQTKFFTMEDVFAEICPSCKSMNLQNVVAFTCEPDFQPAVPAEGESDQSIAQPAGLPPCGALTLAPRGVGVVVCSNPECSRQLTQFKMPSSEELKAWGASGPEESSVMRK